LLALGCKSQHWCHHAREFDTTPARCHPKRDLQRSFRPRAHPRRSETKTSPPIYPKPATHTHPLNPMLLSLTRGGLKARRGNHRLKRRYLQPIALPHISRLHHRSSSTTTTKTHTEKLKLNKISIKTLRMKSKSSSRTSSRTFVQEHRAMWKAVMKRAQIMQQQQIEQERAMQVELQQAIEALRPQEHEPSI
jgi:acetoin utilization deacetylase AcuC-like enzyme